MFYIPINTNFFYGYVDIPDLDKITEELISLKDTATRDVKNIYYFNVNREYARTPFLMKYLDSVGLLDSFSRLLFSSNAKEDAPAHVDSYNPYVSAFSLNIPLIDCEGSYTAWYSTKNPDLTPSSKINPRGNSAYARDEDIVEIKRVEVTRPMLINTTILHRGITNVPSRTICGIRFTRVLKAEDFARLGINRI